MKRKAITLTTVCQKGGVGKTLTTANVAAQLADVTGCQVLVIDCDGQHSLTEYFLKGVRLEELKAEQTTAAFFDDAIRIDPNKMIHPSHKKGLSIVPANEALARHGWPNLTEQPESRTHAIRRFVDLLDGHFPFILIDTSPKLRELPNWAALIASDYVFCPVEPECFAGNAIGPVKRFVRAAQEQNPELHMLGFMLNKVDLRCNDHKTAIDAIRHHHGDQVFKYIVPRLAEFRKAVNARQPIGDFNKSSDAAEIAETVTREIYARILEHQKQTNIATNNAGKEAA